jgi:hypothetical protein
MINPRPVKTYTAPKLPTLQDVREDSALLKQMPLRWRKCTAVIACAGVMGTSILMNSFIKAIDLVPASSTPVASEEIPEAVDVRQNPFTQDGLSLRFHSGGTGMAFYVVHFTEQEALGILQTLLEEAGLRFGAQPPDYSADYSWNDDLISPALFDEDKNAAIAFLKHIDDPFREFTMHAQIVKESFEELNSEINFGVFYTHVQRVTYFRYFVGGNHSTPSRESVSEVFEELWQPLYDNLLKQVNDFVAVLQKAGVEGVNPVSETLKIATPTSLTVPPTTTAVTSGTPTTTPTPTTTTLATTTTTTPTPTAKEDEFLLGDVNGDGKVDIKDALEILKYLAKLPSVLDDGGNAVKNALVYDPGMENPTMLDVIEILKHLAKLPSRIDTSDTL